MASGALLERSTMEIPPKIPLLGIFRNLNPGDPWVAHHMYLFEWAAQGQIQTGHLIKV